MKHPDFNRADLKAMPAGEVDIQESRTHSSDDTKPSMTSAAMGDEWDWEFTDSAKREFGHPDELRTLASVLSRNSTRS